VAEYKVWVQMEQCPDNELEHLGEHLGLEEDYANIGLPDCLGVFETPEQAAAFIRSLPGWVSNGSDYREGADWEPS